MTIREFICMNEERSYSDRLAKLKELAAPAVILKGLEAEIERLAKKQLKVGGSEKLLDAEFESFEQKEGRGGKLYLVINGSINYFPTAKYGRYITEK